MQKFSSVKPDDKNNDVFVYLLDVLIVEMNIEAFDGLHAGFDAKLLDGFRFKTKDACLND